MNLYSSYLQLSANQSRTLGLTCTQPEHTLPHCAFLIIKYLMGPECSGMWKGFVSTMRLCDLESPVTGNSNERCNNDVTAAAADGSDILLLSLKPIPPRCPCAWWQHASSKRWVAMSVCPSLIDARMSCWNRYSRARVSAPKSHGQDSHSMIAGG